MATLRDQIQILRKKNRTPQQIRDAMGKAFNTTPDKLAPFLENDVRDIPGILAGDKSWLNKGLRLILVIQGWVQHLLR